MYHVKARNNVKKIYEVRKPNDANKIPFPDRPDSPQVVTKQL